MNDEHFTRLAELAEKQFGVVASWQAKQAGLSRDQFYRVVEGPGFRWVSQGIYRVAGGEFGFEQKVWAACLDAQGVASHRTAAWLWGLDGVNRAEPRRIELIVSIDNQRRASGATVHRSRSYTDEQRCLVKGMPSTTLARTILDLSQVLGARSLEIAVASALRQEPKLYDQLEAFLARLPLRAAARLARLKPLLVTKDQAVDSAFEVVLRRFLRREKIREPEPQYTVFDGNAFIGRFDFAWPKNNPPVVLQAHGERYHANTDQWRRDLQQASELNEIGWRLIQCSMSDLTQRPRRLSQMIRRALAGYRGDGMYRDDHLRELEDDAILRRGPKRRRP